MKLTILMVMAAGIGLAQPPIGAAATSAPSTDAGQGSVENPMIEPAWQHPSQQVEEVRVQSRRHAQGRIRVRHHGKNFPDRNLHLVCKEVFYFYSWRRLYRHLP